jgi:uncharacterized protein (TIGR03435 family)
MRSTKLVALPLISVAAAFSQQPQTVHDIVSIKPSDTNGRGQFGVSPGGTLAMRAVTLNLAIQGVRRARLPNRRWTGLDFERKVRHSREARGGRPGIGRRSKPMRVRIQALLADRFQLTLHRETREMPVYALVVAKNGRKLKEHTVADQETGLRRGQGQITGNQVAIPFLTLTLLPSTGPLC